MKESKKIDILYDCVRSYGEYLSAQLLLKSELSRIDISNLKKKGYLESSGWGQYKFIDKDRVFSSDVEVFTLDNSDYDEEENMLRCIEENNYKELFQVLYILRQCREADSNLYYFLLGHLVKLPRDEQLLFKSIDKSSLMRDGDSEEEIFLNKISEMAWNLELDSLLEELSKNKMESQNFKLISYLVEKILEKNKILDTKVKNLVSEKKYYELVYFLRDLNSRKKYYRKLYYLAKIYCDVKDAEYIPEKKSVSSNRDLYSLIDANEFLLALKELHGESVYRSILEDICGLLKERSLDNSKNCQGNEEGSPYLKAASMCLKMYGLKNGNDVYFNLLDGLVKLAEMNKSMEESIAQAIVELDNKNFDFNRFIQLFYGSLNFQNFLEAKIYLRIIKSANLVLSRGLVLSGLDAIYDSKLEEYNFYKDYVNNLSQNNIDFIYEKICDGEEIVIVNEDMIGNVDILSKKYPYMKYIRTQIDGLSKIVFMPFDCNAVKSYSELNQLMKSYYNDHQYKECLDVGLEIVRSFSHVSPVIYANIGLCYGKLRNYETALTYLKIGISESERLGNKLDYSCVLAKYEYLLEVRNKKAIKKGM